MIYFVTEKFLKDKTPITQNVDAGDLAPFVPMSVKTYVQPLLGYRFTEDLLAKFNDNLLNPDETELVEFIQYMTAFYSAYDAIPNLTFRISNKGIQSQFGDYSASEGVATVEYIRNNILKFAKKYETDLREFLHLNKANYPLYLDKLNKEIQAPDEQRQARTDTTWL
jgi:hypothetical protein